MNSLIFVQKNYETKCQINNLTCKRLFEILCCVLVILQKYNSEITRMESTLKYYLEIADNSLVLAKQLSRLKDDTNPHFELLVDKEYISKLKQIASKIYIQASKIPLNRQIEISIWLNQRSSKEFYNCLLVEIESSDFYENLVRQLFFDTFNYLYLLETTRSEDEFLAQLSKEKLGYFNRRMFAVQNRILQIKNCPVDDKINIQKAILDLWKYVPDLFQASSADIYMVSRDMGVDLSDLKHSWEENLTTLLRQTAIVLPKLEQINLIGKEGQHTQHLDRLIKK